MFRPVLFLCVLLLTACADRDAVFTLAAPPENAQSHRTFVATLRSPLENGWFGSKRAADLSYLALDVSVPPKRSAGQIRHMGGLNGRQPEKDFGVLHRQDYDSQTAFTGALRNALAAQPSTNRDVLLYVHGYNNSFSDGVYRTVQMKHDFHIEGVAVHYSWASAGNPLGYTYDRDSVLYSRDGLERVLLDISAAKPSRIILVGHSLGTMLVMETLRQMDIRQPGWGKDNLGGVILVSSDLDVDLFEMQAKRLRDLPQPFVVFVSSRDRALQLSTHLNGSKSRLGNLKDPSILDPLPLTVVDVSEFADSAGARHFTLGTSPLLIALLNRSPELLATFNTDRAGRTGLASGAVLGAQRITHLVLSPLLLGN